MKILSSALIVLFSIFFMSSESFASWVFEPYAGYSQGKTEGHFKPVAGLPDGADVGSKFSEISAGLKLGAKASSLGLWIAVDPELGLAGMDKSDSSGNSSPYKRTQVFADLGYDFSIIRAYIGYGLLNEQKDDDTKLSGGTAIKAGVEIGLATNVALLFEYHTNDFKEGSGTNGSFQVSDSYDSLKQSRFVVGLSLPFGGISEHR